MGVLWQAVARLPNSGRCRDDRRKTRRHRLPQSGPLLGFAARGQLRGHGLGHIDRKHPEKDQLVANLAAALEEPMTEKKWCHRDQAQRCLVNNELLPGNARGLVQPTDIP